MKKYLGLLVFLLLGCNETQTGPESLPIIEAPTSIDVGMSPGMRKAYETYLHSPTAKKRWAEQRGWNPASCPVKPRVINGEGLNKSSFVGVAVGVHSGTLHSRTYTWSIIRNYSGHYTPDTTDGMVEAYLQNVVSTWASAANLSFYRVDSGGDITFEWRDSVPGYPTAVGTVQSKDYSGYFTSGAITNSYGGKIIFGHWQHLGGGGPLKRIHWNRPNYILAVGLHEFGHILGLADLRYDSDYGNSNNVECEDCICANCTHPLLNDQSIMSYDAWTDYPDTTSFVAAYLSAYDVDIIQQKYGSNTYGRPLLELWLPSWGEHLYTSKWEEATPLARSGFAQDVNNFPGIIFKDSVAGRTPFHRHFVAINGVGKHLYSAGTRLYTPTPMWYEGVMGYLMTSQGWGTDALYRHYNSYNTDYRYTMDSTPPAGYSSQGVVGYIVPFDHMW